MPDIPVERDPLDRLEVYRKFMNIPEAQTFAALLSLKPATYSTYVTGERAPRKRGLQTLANIMGVSLDWLFGESEEMWGPKVRASRPLFRTLAREISGYHLDNLERCRAMLDLIRTTLPNLTNNDWFLPGLLSLSLSAYRTLINDPETELLGATVIPRLSMFTGIPERWYMLGEHKWVDGSSDYGEYEPFLAAIIADGISPSEALEMRGAIKRLAEAKRPPG